MDEYASLEALPSISAYSGKALASAFFARFPLIQINPRQLLIPSPAFLRIQLGSKFLTKAAVQLLVALRTMQPRLLQQGLSAWSVFALVLLGREALVIPPCSMGAPRR
jgi:hypothetical protein